MDIMDVKYINPFVTSVSNVFSTMLQLDVTFSKPHLRDKEEHTHDVSAIIGLSGDVVGAVVVSFPKLAAIRIASAFSGTAMTEMDEDFADAVGELANMISGNAKKDFDGLNVLISTPSVVLGSGHTIRSTRVMPRLVLPCTTPAGSFVVEVGLKTVKDSNKELVAASAE